MCDMPSFRCACGHVAEWHYQVSQAKGTQGALIFRDPCRRNGFLEGPVRCPSARCDCTEITNPQPIERTA